MYARKALQTRHAVAVLGAYANSDLRVLDNQTSRTGRVARKMNSLLPLPPVLSQFPSYSLLLPWSQSPVTLPSKRSNHALQQSQILFHV